MTKQIKQTPTYALTYIDDVPKWDFGADLVTYSLLMPKNRLLVPAIRQHTDMEARKGFFREEIEALKRSVAGIKFRGDTMEIGDVNEVPLWNFVDMHFERFFGVEPDDPELHKKYLDEHCSIKTRIFREGVQGITYEEPDDDSSEIDSNDISFQLYDITAIEDNKEIELYQHLYSVEKKRVEQVYMTHVISMMSESDYQRYRRATTRKINARKRTMVSLEDYFSQNALYNKLIVRIDGALVNGKPCESENKEDWVDLIPLDHKLLVLSVLVREIEGKNVL